MKISPLTREKYTDSLTNGHNTNVWLFKLNPRRFKLKSTAYAHIYHLDNDLLCNKKYHVILIFNNFKGDKSMDTDNFKEAVKYLMKHTVIK